LAHTCPRPHRTCSGLWIPGWQLGVDTLDACAKCFRNCLWLDIHRAAALRRNGDRRLDRAQASCENAHFASAAKRKLFHHHQQTLLRIALDLVGVPDTHHDASGARGFGNYLAPSLSMGCLDAMGNKGASMV